MDRVTGLLVLEVRMSNPNGNPDRESDPRQRDDGKGEISPVSFKRKLRDLAENKDGVVWKSLQKGRKPEEFEILESRNTKRSEVSDLLEKDFEAFKHKYWDARVFGNTFLEEGQGDTTKTGVVQFGVGLSVGPVQIERHTFTKKAPAQEGKSRGMAPMGFRVVKYGIYYMPFFVNPSEATKTGCTDSDIELLQSLIPYAYDHTKSMIRSMVNIAHAHWVVHKTPLGSFPEFKMIDALTPRLKDGVLQGNTKEEFVIPDWNDTPEELRKRAREYRDLAEIDIG